MRAVRKIIQGFRQYKLRAYINKLQTYFPVSTIELNTILRLFHEIEYRYSLQMIRLIHEIEYGYSLQMIRLIHWIEYRYSVIHSRW